MKKTLLSSSIAIVLSFASINVYAESEDWEKELSEMSKEFSDVDVEIKDLSSLLGDDGEIDTSKLIGEIVEVEPKTVVKDEVTETKLIELTETTTIIKKEPVVETQPIIETQPVIETVKVESQPKPAKAKDVSKYNSELDYIFLRNIPEGTRFTVNNNYEILSKKRFLIFSDGERVLHSPQDKNNLEATFCYFEFVHSGKGRLLKDKTSFIVTGNKTRTRDYEDNKSYGNYTLREHITVFSIDNTKVKNLTCYSAGRYSKDDDEKAPRPLLIKDLKEQTGGVISVEFPAYEEI